MLNCAELRATSLAECFFKLADVVHDGIKFGFLAKVHFSHFLVVPAEGLFELGAGRKAESSLLSEFISRTALAEKVLLMLHDLLQQFEIVERAKAAGMFCNDHNIMIVAKYPFRNGLPRFGAIVLATPNL